MASMKLAPWAFLLLFALTQVTVEALTKAQEKALDAAVYRQQHEVSKRTTPLPPSKVESLPVASAVTPRKVIPKPKGPVAALASLAPVAGANFVLSGTTQNGIAFHRPSNGGPNGVPIPTTLDPAGNGVNYESIRFRVLTAGVYTMQAISTTINAQTGVLWDNFCLLYRNPFNDVSPLTCLLASNDDYNLAIVGVGQCLVQRNLTVGDYIFVTTSYAIGVTGSYSLYAAGPTPIRLQTTFYTASTVGGGKMPLVHLSPPQALSTNPVFFDSFRFTVSVKGTYSLLSTPLPALNYQRVCLLYNAGFSTIDPLSGLITNGVNLESNNVHCSISAVSLVTGVQYYFVTTSIFVGETGTARNSISGPGIATPVPGTMKMTQTTSAHIVWNRLDSSGTLSTVGTDTPYVTTQLCVSSAGTYSFTNTAGFPAWDTYLLLYTDIFNPSKETLNFKIGNDDSPPDQQLVSGFSTGLDKGVSYILVLTGNSNLSMGTATTVITGPGTISTNMTACP